MLIRLRKRPCGTMSNDVVHYHHHKCCCSAIAWTIASVCMYACVRRCLLIDVCLCKNKQGNLLSFNHLNQLPLLPAPVFLLLELPVDDCVGHIISHQCYSSYVGTIMNTELTLDWCMILPARVQSWELSKEGGPYVFAWCLFYLHFNLLSRLHLTHDHVLSNFIQVL